MSVAALPARSLRCPQFDLGLLAAAAVLASLGLVMVASASISIADRETGQPFFFIVRQALYLLVGILLGMAAFRLRLAVWSRAGMVALFLALGLLLLVLVPGVGKTINGSTRWVGFGPFNLQVSEPAKLLVLIYLSGYLVRRAGEVREQVSGFLKPMAVLGLVCILLLAEPDFGATVVLLATALTLMFLAGVRWWQFAILLAVAAGLMALLAVTSPYRMARLTTFLNPWADPFDSGFQLTQSLIAIGRGEWFGVGLGAGVQKLFYLPEAHTDFVFAVLAEELGLLGVLLVIGLYAFFVYRAFAIARTAQLANEPFAGYLAYGIGTWIGLQAFINMGVNMGLLPTKGLTLPLLSYGGSSLVVMCIAVALLLRIDYETRCSVYTLTADRTRARKRRGGVRR
ncbi:putative lipid II flippase FtsW [Thiohalobacter sp. IOR34]|uniref:putative lipid II flippase FtsW n=1 Tax=Thiohalobacter sp. IOR34 TaxID=3057176 RepID=UPI0025B02390|nr:putative lipid II flippase FtsW [Thiohalobacter sp. IOR34]WJW75009.1 putative lipid II flippase FtsW [Thiohalobacter sp. IOR34]